MNAIQLLNELADQGVRLSADGDLLRVRAPKGSLTQQHRRWLTEQRDELLALLSGGRSTSLNPLTPRPDQRYEPFPLTDIQQAYWVGRMGGFNQGDISIHLYVEIDCDGLNLPRLESAWRQMIGRHDMLRSVILADGQQRVLAEVDEYHFTRIDLRGLPTDTVSERLAELRATMAHQVLPTDRWPGFDIRVVLIDETRARLHVSIDLVHIDGASVMLLLSEWVSVYHDPSIQLPPISISYRDYVLAEAELQQSASYRESLAYWQKRVQDLPAAPELPLARSPLSLEHTRFVHRTLKVADDVWSRIKQLAESFDLSSAAVLASVYAEVLATWSTQARFTLNVTVFNRLPFHPEVDRILGDFTSMILLEVDASAHASFVDRARAMQSQLWADLEHHHVSGVRVLRELARVRKQYDGATMPIVFTNMLNLRAKGFSSLYTALERLGDVAFTVMMTPQVWIDYQVHEDADGLRLTWDTVEDLFPAGMQDDMLAAYERRLLELADSRQSWQRKSDLSPEAARTLCRTVNDTSAPVPELLLHDLIAEQVRSDPDRPAVISASRTLSRAELWRHACQLGQRLRALGAQPNGLVAVVMEKGWEQIVAALGVQLSGAAYLPIDPTVPQARLTHLLEHARVELVLTQPAIDGRFTWPAATVRLSVDDPSVLSAPATQPETAQGPRDLAYVLYTSGSTGQPKGVMIEQRSVVNRMLDVNRRIAAGPNDRVLALTALHHDLSVYDTFGILAAGGATVLPELTGLMDPAHWRSLIVQHGVTLWNSVPAFLEMLVEHVEGRSAHAARLDGLRLAILAGDWIPVKLPDRLRALANGCHVIASGGPTETTIWDVWYEIDEVDPEWKSIPYGKPMANTRYYVLDEGLRQRPIWVPGELYIGGDGLARGYLHDAERTAERFITHPTTGERLFRSGDCGRWLPNGTIEFLGRVSGDGQVKIGGHRVELGEIEAALLRHPDVTSAAVLAVGEHGGPRHLVAHVASSRSASAPAAAKGGDASVAFDDVTISDPLQRLAFKAERHGVRRDLGEQPALELVRIARSERVERSYELRRSARDFAAEPVAMEALAGLLGSLLGLERDDGFVHYRYASAGGLYPVQAYVLAAADRVSGMAAGAYYYDPLAHRLVQLDTQLSMDVSWHSANNRALAAQAAFSVFLVAQLDAIRPLYGELARDFCLVEAGYMGQLLMSEAQSHGLGLCPIGGLAFDALRRAFRLSEGHVLVHSFLGGAQAVGPARRAAPSTSGDLVSELRSLLMSELPAPLVPASIVVRERMPITSNGKVDRTALLAEAASRAAEADAVDNEVEAGPSGQLVREIAKVVGEVLGIERVGLNTSFFELGGTSVQIVKIARRLEGVLGREIALTEMFRNPTVRALALRLSGVDAGQSELDGVRARASARLARRGR